MHGHVPRPQLISSRAKLYLGPCHARDISPMTPIAFAELLERYAASVTELPGVSRTNPHVFAEAKSELSGQMRADAKQLRTSVAPRVPARPVGEIGTGTRTIGRREVAVERRRRA